MSIPNIITIIRMVLIPFFVWAYLSNGTYAGIIVLIIIGFTDLLDGFIARKFNMVTKLGQILDPLADKLVETSVCICLLLNNIMPIWFVIILIVKEALMVAGSGFLFKKYAKYTPAKWYGKLATVCFYGIVLTAFFFGDFLKKNPLITNIMFGIAVFLSVFSLVSYYNIYFRNRKNQESKDNNHQEVRLTNVKSD